MKRVVAAALVAVAVAAGGCQKRTIMPRDLVPPRVDSAGPAPTYAELVERYNANLAGVERLWSSADVKIAWRDDNGKARFEQGDGNFLFIPPRNVALTVEKLGKTFIWAGSDDERFWLFERQEDNAYVGRHEHVRKACAEPLPLPIHPATVPYLLGLMPLQLPSSGGGGRESMVEVEEGYYVIEPPGLALRMMLDPRTAQPVRIDLVNARGESTVVARLRDHRAAPLTGVPGSADLYVTRQDARLTLELKRVSTEAGKIPARAFDFEALTKAMKPKEIVELDAGCE